MEASRTVEATASLKAAATVETASLEAAATKATRAIKTTASTAREVQRPLIEGLTLEGTLGAELSADIVDGQVIGRAVQRSCSLTGFDPLVQVLDSVRMLGGKLFARLGPVLDGRLVDRLPAVRRVLLPLPVVAAIDVSVAPGVNVATLATGDETMVAV
jgi:hypothetical protein